MEGENTATDQLLWEVVRKSKNVYEFNVLLAPYIQVTQKRGELRKEFLV